MRATGFKAVDVWRWAGGGRESRVESRPGEKLPIGESLSVSRSNRVWSEQVGSRGMRSAWSRLSATCSGLPIGSTSLTRHEWRSVERSPRPRPLQVDSSGRFMDADGRRYRSPGEVPAGDEVETGHRHGQDEARWAHQSESDLRLLFSAGRCSPPPPPSRKVADRL